VYVSGDEPNRIVRTVVYATDFSPCSEKSGTYAKLQAACAGRCTRLNPLAGRNGARSRRDWSALGGINCCIFLNEKPSP
jgi:hypothetical protein